MAIVGQWEFDDTISEDNDILSYVSCNKIMTNESTVNSSNKEEYESKNKLNKVKNKIILKKQCSFRKSVLLVSKCMHRNIQEFFPRYARFDIHYFLYV